MLLKLEERPLRSRTQNQETPKSQVPFFWTNTLNKIIYKGILKSMMWSLLECHASEPAMSWPDMHVTCRA